ncbi:hypothetical protein F5883DRAFT_545350 [Diaporthe sp. PMI_573]|nr:hypothetical protein F5883DRAFT_545350 [Diaporthaceae sp. PMI_573]
MGMLMLVSLGLSIHGFSDYFPRRRLPPSCSSRGSSLRSLVAQGRGLRHNYPICATQEAAQRRVQLVGVERPCLGKGLPGQTGCVLRAGYLTTNIVLEVERDAHKAPPAK